MKQIPLTQGKFALVDDEDFEELSQLKWHATELGKNWYAFHSYKPDTKLKGKKAWTQTSMHRIIMKFPVGLYVDHINGNGLDNQKLNLRLCTPHQSSLHRPNMKRGFSKYRGVCWHKRKKKWQAEIGHRGKLIYIGMYKTENDAAAAYNIEAERRFGDYATLNVLA